MWRKWSFEVTTQKPGREAATTPFPETFSTRAKAEDKAYRVAADLELSPRLCECKITYRLFRIGER